MTARAWPTVPPIPPAARRQWRALTAALEDREPPCSTAPWLWFAQRPAEIRAARRLCRTCHAFAECDEYATAAHEDLGVWAGCDRKAKQ